MIFPEKPLRRFSKNQRDANIEMITPVASGQTMQSRTPSPGHANPQSQSQFFSQLPLEIRILIYDYVVQSFGWIDAIHIVTRSQLTRAAPAPWLSAESIDAASANNLAHVPCAARVLGDPFQISGSHYGHWPRGHLACERIASWRTARPADGPPKPKDFTLEQFHLALFLSCKRMYSEVSDRLYSKLSFDTLGLEATDRFLTTVSRRHLDQIRKLHVSWQTTVPVWVSPSPENVSELDRLEVMAINRTKLWNRVCGIIKDMKNLQDLFIAIYDVNWRPTPEDELLMPALEIHIQQGQFIVELRSVEGDDIRKSDIFTGEDEAPFQVKRRPKGFDQTDPQIDIAITNGRRRRRRPHLWWALVPFLCVYYTVETLIESAVESIRR